MSVNKQHFVELEKTVCNDPASAEKLEWWLANGLGGYASGTVCGELSRRYHGLLVAAIVPPLGRMLLMARADATLLADNVETPLYSNRWHQGERVPEGCRLLQRFYLDGDMPVWQFRVGDITLEQRIWMPHAKNQTCVAYRLVNSPKQQKAPRLNISFIAGCRDHHHVSNKFDYDIASQVFSHGLQLNCSTGQQLVIYSEQAVFKADNTWIEDYYLQQEQLRGLEFNDNHLRVGSADIELSDEWRGFVVSSEALEKFNLADAMATEYQRLADLLEEAFPGLRQVDKPAWVFQLVLAADNYLIQYQGSDGENKDSIIAGYPWFGDWGRDTMIALPGLCLATGQYDIAWQILKTFSDFVDEGMLPNNFPANGQVAEYNTVDAALWFIEAWRAYLEASGDLDAIEEVLPLLQEIIFAYRDGTRYGIVMDEDDGLIRAGVPGQQLTWMDARVDGREITPRHGKPVEINALWYNALAAMQDFCQQLGLPGDEYAILKDKTGQGFQRFVRPDGLGLYDVLDGPGGHDAAIRPNQIFCLSLAYSPLTSNEDKQAVLEVCRQHLLTPVGLRSLSPEDKNYIGRYAGGVAQRDGSYHQGTVWGWLLGHYALAEFHVSKDAVAAQENLYGLHVQLSHAGLGQLSEIFDADAPHAPKGAPAQAWSVACTLQAWWTLERAKITPNKR